jgi:hypothetical protein
MFSIIGKFTAQRGPVMTSDGGALVKYPAEDGVVPPGDPVARERANMQHWALEKTIVDLCSAHGIAPLTNQHIDLVVRSGTTSVVFEVKACAPWTLPGRCDAPYANCWSTGTYIGMH